MSDFLYYCGRCNSLVADTADNEEIACKKCGHNMSPLHINEEEWAEMTTDEKRENLLKYRSSRSPARANNHSYSNSSNHKKKSARRKKMNHLLEFLSFSDDKRFMIMIGAIIGVIAILISAVLISNRDSKRSDDNISNDNSASEMYASNDVIETPNLDDTSENPGVTESEPATNYEENNTKIINLSDGPIIYVINNPQDPGDISFMQYSLLDNKKYEVFRFYNPKDYSGYKYNLSVKLLPTDVNDASCFKRQIFDSTMSRIAVCWNEPSDSSTHVGWVDKNGNLTDVTGVVHPSNGDFSNIAPKDLKPFFTSNDLLGFFDTNNRVFCYYSDTEKRITDTYTPEKFQDAAGFWRDSFENDGDFNYWMKEVKGLDDTDRPVTYRFHDTGEYYYSIDERRTQDYVKYDDGYVFFSVDDNEIKDYGLGVSELSNDGPMYRNREARTITPKTDYKIENLAYAKESIIFTATKGTEIQIILRQVNIDL